MSALDWVPWNGVHEFRPWTVTYRVDGTRWVAPGCTCGQIRSAGPPDEPEASMREWFERHLTQVTTEMSHTVQAILRCAHIQAPSDPKDGDRIECPCGHSAEFVVLDDGLPGEWVDLAPSTRPDGEGS